MKVVDSGRTYELSAGNRLRFLQKEDGRVTRHGTTNEEVLEVLIHRVTEAYQTLPCRETIRALHFLGEALTAFQTRTAVRVRANVEGTHKAHAPVTADADESPNRATLRAVPAGPSVADPGPGA
jgi:hypothetical protein